MSYILDALKKAESERKHGWVPNPSTQHTAYVAPLPDKPFFRPRPWMWVAPTALATLLIALAWAKPWQAAPSASAMVATAPSPRQPAANAAIAAPQPANALPSLPIVTPSSDTHVAASATAPHEQPQPPKETPETPAKPVQQQARPAKEPAQKKPAKATVASRSQPAKDSKPARAAAPSINDRRNERVAALRELPQDIQTQLPALKVSGYIYSDNKADRTVLINNRLLREGDQVAPDLTLEILTPAGMVLNYKGYRYRTSY